LLAHKDALFSHLTGRLRDLFNADFHVLLYDLTSTYLRSTPRICPRATNVATATAATSGPIARNW
jgi:hypothetical protein